MCVAFDMHKRIPPGFEHLVLKSHVDNNSQQYMPHTCRNCGLQGHLYKDCPHPIMSFGLICYRLNGDDIEYLMIQRKDSLSFMEFIRGKYKPDQIQYILQLLRCMAKDERQLLLTKSFEELWNIIWYQPSLPRQTSEFHDAKRKFDTLKNGVCVGGQIITLAELLKLAPSPYTDPEWGFPKGRRRLREEDIHCAVREFCEETAFEPPDIKVVTSFPPFEEIFFGTNNVLYRHVYYIACLQGDQARSPSVDPSNVNQAREVRAVAWFKYDDILTHIRDHNQERKELFKQAHEKIDAYLKTTRQ